MRVFGAQLTTTISLDKPVSSSSHQRRAIHSDFVAELADFHVADDVRTRRDVFAQFGFAGPFLVDRTEGGKLEPWQWELLWSLDVEIWGYYLLRCLRGPTMARKPGLEQEETQRTESFLPSPFSLFALIEFIAPAFIPESIVLLAAGMSIDSC
jgi:hypothetical protein